MLKVNKLMQPGKSLPRCLPRTLTRRCVLQLAIVLGVATVSSAATAQAEPRYAVTVVGGAGSVAYDVNNGGDVVGQLAVGDLTHAFIYSGSALVDLGNGSANSSTAFHVNDLGQVVGSQRTAGTDDISGFLYSGGALSTLAGSFSAYGINNSGTITGVFGVVGADGFAYPHAYSYAGGVYTDAGTLIDEGGSYGYAINNAGAIVGAADWATGANRPTNVIVYQNGVLTDLGAFDGPWSYGYSINDLGHVVGSGTIFPVDGDLYPRRALFYNGGALQNLGSLMADAFSEAYDINNLDQIVGAAETSGGLHGFLYEDGAMVDLNALLDPASGWTLVDARAINDVQQIAGTACKDGLCYAVRLDLVPQAPEPASWAMCGFGLGVVALARRRRRGRPAC